MIAHLLLTGNFWALIVKIQFLGILHSKTILPAVPVLTCTQCVLKSTVM